MRKCAQRSLCRVVERIVAAVHLTCAALRSFRHSCSGRPPSRPAALLIARLYPASLQRSVSSSGPTRPLSCKETPVTPTHPFALPCLLAFVRSACAAAGASSWLCQVCLILHQEEEETHSMVIFGRVIQLLSGCSHLREDSLDIQLRPHCFPRGSFHNHHLTRKLLEHLAQTCQQRLFARAPLRRSPFAVGRRVELAPDRKSNIREMFPALGLQVRRHHPRKKLCRILACDADVDVSVEVAIGTWVACNSFDQALTCRSPSDALVIAVNKTPSGITECLLRNKRSFFVLLWFLDAGDDAPSQKQLSHVAVRLLLRLDVKTTTPSIRMPKASSKR